MAPFGLHGGGDGAKGLNLLHANGKIVNLRAKNSVDVKAGDCLEIRTPGGGAWGSIGEDSEGLKRKRQKEEAAKRSRVA